MRDVGKGSKDFEEIRYIRVFGGFVSSLEKRMLSIFNSNEAILSRYKSITQARVPNQAAKTEYNYGLFFLQNVCHFSPSVASYS